MTTEAIPATSQRVPQNTDESVNDRIRRQTEANIAYYSAEGRKHLEKRLEELGYEWDIERVLESNAAAISILGLSLGALVNRRWFALPMVVASFLLQHAVQGWCPPVGLFRRLGIRTQTEIEEERYALKAIRGDFRNIKENGEGNTETVIQAIRR